MGVAGAVGPAPWPPGWNGSRATDATGAGVVVLQGGRDGTVDGPYNVDVLRRLYDVELFEIPEARHHLVNEAAAIRERMWRFLDGHLHGDALAAAQDSPTNSPPCSPP